MPNVERPRCSDSIASLGISRRVYGIVAVANLEPRLSSGVDRICGRVVRAGLLTTGRLRRARRHRVAVDIQRLPGSGAVSAILPMRSAIRKVVVLAARASDPCHVDWRFFFLWRRGRRRGLAGSLRRTHEGCGTSRDLLA